MLPEISPTKRSEMRDRVLETFSFQPAILGSKLGEVLLPFIKPYTSFSQVGGLRPFVSENLPDTLEWYARTNGTSGDDKYRLIAEPKAEWVDVTSLHTGVFWANYSNPRIDSRFALPPSREALYSCPSAACDLPEDWKEIRKISEEDYRRMALEFTDSIHEEYRIKANQIIQQKPFNSAWVFFLRETQGSDVLRSWEEARVQKVREILRDSLEESGCSQHLVRAIDLYLSESRSSRKRIAPRQPEDEAFPASSVRTSRYDRSSSSQGIHKQRTRDRYESEPAIRSLLHRAIDLMSALVQ